MKLTFLGTGTSFGVPQIACGCAVCHSADPRDRRTRCGAVIDADDGTRLLIDTPPELRLQLVAAGVLDIDAVLFTHEHADHIHGIDDLRAFTMRRSTALPLYGSAETLRTIRARFPYIVDDRMRPIPGTTKPEGTLVEVTAGVPFRVRDTEILPFSVPHGRTEVLAYRVGDVAYVTDAKSVPDEALAALAGVRVLVLNALMHKPHPTHLSISDAIAVARQVGAEQTYLTHLTHESFHANLAAELPEGISPAYDGLVVEIPTGAPATAAHRAAPDSDR